MFPKSRTSSDRSAPMPIIPVRPDAALSGAPAASRPAGLLRRTLGRGNPSRRTFGVSHPSRRTFGINHPSAGSATSQRSAGGRAGREGARPAISDRKAFR